MINARARIEDDVGELLDTEIELTRETCLPHMGTSCMMRVRSLMSKQACNCTKWMRHGEMRWGDSREISHVQLSYIRVMPLS